jgi:nucleoside-diphosphate-sugar epimerase
MRHIILRPSHVYGPESDHFTIRPLKMLLRNQAVLVGGGRYHFKPLYIDNFVDAALLAFGPEVSDGATYNLCDGYVRTWRELFEAYARLVGQPTRLPSLPVPLALALGFTIHHTSRALGRKPFFSHRTVHTLTARNSYSAALAHRELGWQPAVDFEAGITAIGEWLHSIGGPEALLR